MKRIFPLIFVVAFLLLLLGSATPVGAQSSAILFTGKVTSEATGAPLANVDVVFIDTLPLDTTLAATTDSSGLYTITQTFWYTWRVKFVPPDSDHIPEFYDNVYDLEGATKFTFALGMVVSGIDASLAVRGQSKITGKITGAPNDTPVADVAISVYAENGRWLKDADRSDSTGVYTVTELAQGAYKLHFSSDEFALEYYKNKRTVTTADVIEVGSADLVQGVDVSLDVGGVITGVVTSSQDGSEIYARVSAYDLNHELIAVGRSFYFNDDGYIVNSLPPGDYRLLFEFREGRYRSEYYDNQPTLDQAQRVTVNAGKVTANINAELAYTPIYGLAGYLQGTAHCYRICS